MKPSLLFACVLALVAAGCSSGSTTTGAAEAGDVTQSATEASADEAASDWPLSFDGDTVSGSAFESGDYEGQDLVLWFWAPW